jgi:hypothetical protein
VYQAATDRYAAYSYDWDQNITRLDYGTNAAGAISLNLLKLPSEQVREVRVDGRPVDFWLETEGQDTTIAFAAPAGRHQVEIIKNQAVIMVAAAPTGEPPPASPGLARHPPPPPGKRGHHPGQT